jgi:hypothetical protein
MTPSEFESGVEEPATYVNFEYDPAENYTYSGYTYGEFESIVFIELRVPMGNREGWSIVPLEWHIGIDNTAGDEVVSASTCTSIALYRPPDNPNSFETTAFFEDFEGDISDWNVGDENQDPEAGLDYWGIYDTHDFWGHRMYCAEVGNNSMWSEVPNKNISVYGVYDIDMDAYLTRSVNFRPFQNFKLRYYLMYDIDIGDYLAVEYYNNGQWFKARPDYTSGTDLGSYYETQSIPNSAERIRFRFHSEYHGYRHLCFGAFVDNIQVRAKLPNDAGNMTDAGGDFGSATLISISDSYNNYAGYLGNDQDWYKFYITPTQISNRRQIYVLLNQPSNSIFNVTLYYNGTIIKAGPTSSGQPLTHILSSSDQPGWWQIQILPVRGFGQYDFDIQLKPSYQLTVKTKIIEGDAEVINVNIWVDGVRYLSLVNITLSSGNHIVQAELYFYRRVYWLYTFDHWGNGSTNNTITVNATRNIDLTAYYHEEYCPTLFVWNGTQYVYEALLNIHAATDITVQHQIQQTLAPDGIFYKLQLRELDNFTSHIDQVKLYAVDANGGWHTCPLTIAKLNDTYVTLKLLLDDDRRVDLYPSQIINLKFIPSIPYSQTAHFVFEINGYNRKLP